MGPARPLALLAMLGAGCASVQAPGPAGDDLGARLVSRAEQGVGQAGPFVAAGERFPADCSGYVSSIYQAEGIPLRQLMAHAAPAETSGVAAAYQAARSYGVVFGGGGEWPQPGDLVFFHDTYDRNRNGRVDDPFTHMGIVERVEDGTVTFLHRGARAVARGTLTREQPGRRRDDAGRELNSVLRDKRPRIAGEPSLAGELFMAYGRIDPERIPRQSAAR